MSRPEQNIKQKPASVHVIGFGVFLLIGGFFTGIIFGKLISFNDEFNWGITIPIWLSAAFLYWPIWIISRVVKVSEITNDYLKKLVDLVSGENNVETTTSTEYSKAERPDFIEV